MKLILWVNFIFIPIFQVRKLRLTEVKQLSQDHVASEWI